MSAQKFTVGGVLSGVGGVLGLSALAGVLVTVMVAPAIAVTGMTANNTIGIFEGLPEYLALNQGSQRNEIVALNADGSEFHIADVYFQNREEVTLDQMSPYLKMAAVDGEDRRFYDHGGVDVPSVIRAAIGQLTGDDAGGASTLTMQLVRNVIVQDIENNPDLTEDEKLTQYQEATDPSFDRKLREMKLAIGLEKRYTKDEILQAYLNIATFGNNTYGVQAAAQQYFSKPAKDLSIAESASLMAIVQYPNDRNLGDPDNFQANQDRRDVILKWMRDLGDISDAEYQEAVDTPVDENFVHYQAPSNGCLAADYDYRFPCDYATTVIDDLEALGATTEERRDNWRRGGYKVVLTIDPTLQNVGSENARAAAPPDESRFQLGAAVSSVRVGTGEILIMGQNKLFDNTKDGGGPSTTAVNFNVDQEHNGGAGFQPGSTYKPYVLLAFLDAGHGINETFNASVLEVPSAKFQDSCTGGNGGPPFKFHNDAGEKGLYTVARGTAESVNSVFIQMASLIDQCRIKQLAQSIGVHRGDGAPDGSDLSTLPSCAIGGCENNITPLTQAAAYAAIANGGVYCKPIIIKKLIASDGSELPGQKVDCGQSKVSPAVAHAAAYAMQGVMNGTARDSNPRDGTSYIAKTGTTDDSIHTWMVGSSTAVSTAVWVGNIEGKQPLRNISVNGNNAAQLRHVIFRPIAQAIDQVFPGGEFPSPESQYLSGSPVFVPDGLIGGTPEQAKAAIELALLFYADGGPIDSDLPVGVVAKIDPAGGASVPRGTEVKVYTSNGQAKTVPDVTGPGSTFSSAEADLNTAEFMNVVEACVVPPGGVGGPGNPAEGEVVAQNPAAGSVVNKSTQITVTTAHATCPGSP
ncbi:MAG: transglycosylase domain-containing protein [Actinomycetales bacterium]|nr:transglycosylase domain-containing protein [Actinomycetales bacterium]